MSLWNKLFKQDDDRVDYYHEGLELLRAAKYHEALTSFRLALRDAPADATVLQQMAITYTRIGMTDEAVRTYRQVLADDESTPGAHYGLAFLMLREGRHAEAKHHLDAFLAAAPDGPEAAAHISYARQTLGELAAGNSESAADGETGTASGELARPDAAGADAAGRDPG